MTILVTGATGRLGRATVAALLESIPAEEIAVGVRDVSRATDLRGQGADVRHLDYDEPSSLGPALAGVDRLLLISSSDLDDDKRMRQHRAVVDAAAAAGVSFIAYTSCPRAATTDMSIAALHRATEEAILETTIPYAFLRNNWYLENEVEEIDTVQHVRSGGSLVTAAGDARTGWALRDDLARAAAAVLVQDGHDFAIYELGGPPATYDEFGMALGEVLGRDVAVEHVDDATYGRVLAERGVPYADLMLEFQQELRAGVLDVESSDLVHLLGRPPVSLVEGLRILVTDLDRTQEDVR